MAFNSTLLKQSALSKSGEEQEVSVWRRRWQRIRQEPLSVVLLVWAVLFLLAWLTFAWLD